MLIVLVKNTSKSDVTLQQKPGGLLRSHQALGLCSVIQEWNCILWSKMYWDCCLRGGLSCMFLEGVAPSRAVHTRSMCAKSPKGTGELLLRGWFSLIYIVCITLYYSSLYSSFKLQQQIDERYMGYMQNLYTCEPAKRCETCPAAMAKGEKISQGDSAPQAVRCESENG